MCVASYGKLAEALSDRVSRGLASGLVRKLNGAVATRWDGQKRN